MSIVAYNHSSKHQGLELGEKEIFSHNAWHGDLSGMECEDLLRGHIPGSYLLKENDDSNIIFPILSIIL